MLNAKRICTYLDVLKNNSSTNDKVELLKEYLQDDLFKRMCQLALISTYSYNMGSIPKNVSSGPLFSKEYSLSDVFDKLEELSKKSGMTNEEKMEFAEIVSPKEFHRIATLIIQKKLDCGVDAKLINKAVPKTVFIMPYMRCHSTKQIHRIKYPAILDVKADGMFLNTIVVGGKVEYRTRPGLIFPLRNKHLDALILSKFGEKECVLLGEARILKDAEYQPRKTGNGLLNSILKSTAPQYVHDSVVLTVWDYIPYDDFIDGGCKLQYRSRLEELVNAGLTSELDILNRIENEVVNYKEDAYAITELWIEKGGEGGVLKNLSGIWKGSVTSPDQIKLKSEKICELRIIGWAYGEAGSKYESLMGSVICESEDKKLQVSVSGWTDEERGWNWNENIGKIISVKFNEVIESKSKSTTSLFLPRVNRKEGEFVELRLDKDVADTYEYITSL